MKRLYCSHCRWLSSCTAGCSSSVDNPPDVTPTDPTTGNLAPPLTGTLSPNRVLFSPNQGVLPYPARRLLHADAGCADRRHAEPAFERVFPGHRAHAGQTTTEPVVNALDGFSTQAPIKLRFSTTINLTTSAAGIRLVEVHIDPATKATVGFPTTASPVRRVLVQDVDYRVEIAPNIDTGGTLDPDRAAASRCSRTMPRRDPPARATSAIWCSSPTRCGPRTARRSTADADYATIKTAALAPTPARTITDARLNALCNLARAHFGAAQAAGVNPDDDRRLLELHHAVRRDACCACSRR